jgi:hypothetical protein
MKSSFRRTFRPALESLEDRLTPSFQWGIVSSPDLAAPHPATASQTVVGPTMPASTTTVATAITFNFTTVYI